MKLNKKKIQNVIFFISLMYLTFFLPLLITIYSVNWYEFNYKNQEITKQIQSEKRENATINLISFFSYNENLNSLWNEKEKNHMLDVRQIYLYLQLFALICLVLLVITFDKTYLQFFSKINIYILFSFLLLLPVFSFLFSGIFHELLFNNTNWIITSEDMSYYLFPIEFFKNSFLFIVFFAILENIMIYFISSKIK